MPQPSAPRPTRPGPTIGAGVALIAVLVIAVNLRPGATTVGPVLAEVRTGLGIGAGLAGVLTALPGLCFALVGALAVRIAARIGVTAGITAGLVLIALALVLRSLVGSGVAFLALSVVALGGMAVGNVLVPAWIKRHSSDGGRRLMTVYSAGLTLGGSLGSLTAAPVAASAGWRAALGLWGLVALLAAALWAVLLMRERRVEAPDRAAPAQSPQARVHHSRVVVGLTGLFGIQSMNAYVQFGWLPQILRDAGMGKVEAGSVLAFVAALGVLGGLLMPTLIARSRDLSWAMWLFGLLLAAGYLGLLWRPAELAWLWATLLGLSGFAFPMAIALITARTRHPRTTAMVSGFVQPTGYLLAAAGPFLVGVVHDLTHGWTVVLWLLVASAVAMVAFGLRAAHPVYVDDELAR
ncbi:MFS transporter [Arsenicicoccus piscis]|nr:MFS transporter [Arsenicicoccus piscis]MCH8628185.1 MFS transporter [Arsenicicoccus piscis]